MARTKTEKFLLVLSPEEKELFDKRMEQTGITNRTAFIRKMCIDGHVIRYDSELINEIGRLTRITSNNMNQIAHRVNSGGNAPRDDISEMNSNLIEVRKLYGELLGLLSGIADPKPGKRFMQPHKYSDVTGSNIELPTAEGGR